MSAQAPDADLSMRYFGPVTLAVVPGRDSDSPAATQFFFQDQIGLHIEGLKQHLRLPFELRATRLLLDGDIAGTGQFGRVHFSGQRFRHAGHRRLFVVQRLRRSAHKRNRRHP